MRMGPAKLAVVLVLYRRSAQESKTWQTLSAQAEIELLLSSLLLWHNSEEQQDLPSTLLPTNRIRCVVRPDNPGLAVAYNAAVEGESRSENEWLLTLDQDTNLPPNLLREVCSAIASEIDPSVVAFCPIVVQQGKQFSPIHTRCGIPWPTAVASDEGVSHSPISAINSGLCVSIDFLREIGGYSMDYPLDFLDHWLCREIYRRGKKIRVLPVVIEHDLSVNTFEKSVSADRYQNILSAQRRFFHSCGRPTTRILYVLMMFRHAVKKTISTRNQQIIRTSWQEFCRSFVS